MTSSTTRSSHKIYIDERHYILVDGQGYAKSVSEGSVGCIIALRDDNTGRQYALKIPRLRADTLPENAYIERLTKDELTNATIANVNGGGVGLIRLSAINDPLVRRRQTEGVSDEAALQNDCVILIQFDQNRPEPRFVAVKELTKVAPSVSEGASSIHHSPLAFYPETLDEKQKQIIATHWNDAKNIKGMKEFDIPGYIIEGVGSNGADSLENQIFAPKSVNSGDQAIWYFGLTAIVYEWARGTLQASIGTGLIKKWRIGDYTVLLDSVAIGLETLHNRNLLHCDLRPANIMWCADGGRSAAQYLVNDYGSFAVNTARLGGNSETGNTLTAAGIAASSRVSPFYARERRQAIQRESAEIAIIVAERAAGGTGARPNNNWIVRLGWKAELLRTNDGQTSKPDDVPKTLEDLEEKLADEIVNEILASAMSSGQTPARGATTPDGKDERLRRGDRIRIRDLIFEVVDARDLGASGLVVTCQHRVARVLHDKVAVLEDNVSTVSDGMVMSIPSYAEYYQWTAATDLFSLGTLALYCPFMNQLLLADGAGNRKASVRRVEEQFDEFFQLVTNNDYFRFVWDSLSCFRYMVAVEAVTQSSAGEGFNASQVRAMPVKYRGGISLRKFAEDVVKDIVQVIPHVRELLRAFPKWDRANPDSGYADNIAAQSPGNDEIVNMGDFLLYMHFALGCLHRKAHFGSEGGIESDEREYRTEDAAPFCVDRFEMPKPIDFQRLEHDEQYARETATQNAISRAKLSLENNVGRVITNTWMAAFDIALSEIPPRSDNTAHEVLLEKIRLKNELDELQSNFKVLRSEAADIVTKRLRWWQICERFPGARSRKAISLIQKLANENPITNSSRDSEQKKSTTTGTSSQFVSGSKPSEDVTQLPDNVKGVTTAGPGSSTEGSAAIQEGNVHSNREEPDKIASPTH